MVEPEINQEEKKEVILVKKGLFYYLFQLILLPFRLIYWLINQLWKYTKIYLGWLQDYSEAMKKKKNLNKYLSVNKLNDEVL